MKVWHAASIFKHCQTRSRCVAKLLVVIQSKLGTSSMFVIFMTAHLVGVITEYSNAMFSTGHVVTCRLQKVAVALRV